MSSNCHILSPFFFSSDISSTDIAALQTAAPTAAFFSSISIDQDSDTDTASEGESDVPSPLSTLYDPSAKDLSPEDLSARCGFVSRHLRLTSDQVSAFEEVTRTQAESRTWHVHRIGRVTASIVHKMCSGCPDREKLKTVMRYASFSLSHVPAVKWGREKENTARLPYEQQMQALHQDFHLRQTGLLVKEDEPFLAASPDGVFECECCGQGTLEIKCPYKYRVSFDGCDEDVFFCLDKNRNLKRNHPYYFQVQFQMFVVNVSFCHFVVWTPSVFFICKVVCNVEFQTDIVSKCSSFFSRSILPELLTRSNDPSLITDKCSICDCLLFGKIIACSVCSSSFHHKCVNIVRSSKKWKCATCSD
jgi:hypothetical protein